MNADPRVPATRVKSHGAGWATEQDIAAFCDAILSVDAVLRGARKVIKSAPSDAQLTLLIEQTSENPSPLARHERVSLEDGREWLHEMQDALRAFAALVIDRGEEKKPHER